MFTLKFTSILTTDEAKAKVRAALMPRLKKCGYLVEAKAKRLLSKGRSTKRMRLSKTTGAAEKVVEREPSAPGTPPHILTGNLRSSIKTEEDGDVVVVGPTTTAWYGVVHEFGGRFHPARPFMRPALQQCATEFAPLFAGLDFTGS